MEITPELINYLEDFLTPRRKELFEKVINQRTNHFTVVTEDVYQLHNTSAVIRSCDVFGVQNIHVIEERNLKKIDREIAMGAQKWVSLNRHHSSKECIKDLRESGYQIVATTPHGNTQNIQDFDVTKPSAIFFGTERHGLSQEIMEQADAFIKIPMRGFTESLNISVSAAIILQYLTQELRNKNVSWELSDVEKNLVKYEWLQKSFKDLDKIVEDFKNK